MRGAKPPIPIHIHDGEYNETFILKVITSGSPMKETAAGLFGMTTTALQQ